MLQEDGALATTRRVVSGLIIPPCYLYPRSRNSGRIHGAGKAHSAGLGQGTEPETYFATFASARAPPRAPWAPMLRVRTAANAMRRHFENLELGGLA